MSETVYQTEVVIAAVCFLLATLIFAPTDWHNSYPGRILFIVLLNFAVVLTLISVTFWFGDYGHRDIIRFLIYTLTMINGLVILVSLVIGQLIGHNHGRNQL